ncbi:MAG: HAMP domain-containing histidine kinase [Reichenbachiella sp.]
MVDRIIDLFVNQSMFSNQKDYKQARFITRASILTGLFSGSYIFLSMYFAYEKGVYLMIFNFFGFILLPLLFRLKLSKNVIGNTYVFIGAIAVLILVYYSGGMYSGIFPWLISIPILAMLVVGRKSSYVWAIITFGLMQYFSIKTMQGFEFPIEFNQNLKIIQYSSVMNGLFLIIYLITLIFEKNRNNAVKSAINRNNMLSYQKKKTEVQAGELKQLVDDKDTLINMIAHDLKTPLGNIINLIEFLRSDTPTEEDKLQYIELIDQSTKKSLELIYKVLDTGKDQKNIYDLKMERLQVGDLLNENLELVSELASTKNIKLIKASFDKDTYVLLDGTYFSLIIENILTNAIKFSNPGERVYVGLNQLKNNILITIKDNGPGFSDDDKKKMFGKYERLSAQPTGGEISTGLGLSLVKKYAELLHGKVWCESEQGKGSTFFLEFNLAK